ncbi:MAG TPA: RidA family protein [Amycolatopsis sp.]|nr:RidA family protein [Amycolatopsis sp.]
MSDAATTSASVQPAGLPVIPGFAWGRVAGGLLFTSGHVSIDSQGVLVGEGDPAAQAAQCLKNLTATLVAAGSGPADIVKLTCFVVSPDAYRALAAARKALFPDTVPASSTVLVAGLLDPGYLMEIEAVAFTEEGRAHV